MNSGNWSFRPGPASSLAALIAVSLFIALGFWQLDRADQKQELFEQYQARNTQEAVDINSLIDRNTAEIAWYRVNLAGKYLDNNTVLLDNRISGGQAGYYVYSPFEITGPELWVLVNRGWIPAGKYRSSLPAIHTPAGMVNIYGKVKRPPYAGILLSADNTEVVSAGVIRTQSINLEQLGKLMGIKFTPFVVRLEPESDTGFQREWPLPGFGKERHLGYAFQWFAMAVTVVVIFVVLNSKRAVKN